MDGKEDRDDGGAVGPSLRFRNLSNNCPFAAEQEFAEIGLLAEQVGIETPHVSRPCPPHQIGDHRVMLAQAAGNAGLEGNLTAPPDVVVQEVEFLAAHGLQLPERACCEQNCPLGRSAFVS